MSERATCMVQGCTRFVVSKGLCKRHYRRLLDGAKPEQMAPVRGWKRKEDGAVQFLGLRMKASTRLAIETEAANAKPALSPSGAASAILDCWAEQKLWSAKPAPRGPGPGTRTIGGLMLGLALFVVPGNLSCATSALAAPAGTFTKPMPPKPLEDQRTPPCPKHSTEKNGSCWVPYRDETGKQVRGCLDEEILYQDADGLCWTPARTVRKSPRSVGP